jgi:hypothetical protein
MSSVSERERQLILEFLLGRITEETFRQEFPLEQGQEIHRVQEILQTALRARDPEGVELGLNLGHRFGFSESHVELLCRLAIEDWHQRHEDAVMALAKVRSPKSVDALFRAAMATHAYLEYDEAFALGVKSIYALGAIATVEAIERLRGLAACGNVVLEREARAELARLGAGTI